MKANTSYDDWGNATIRGIAALPLDDERMIHMYDPGEGIVRLNRTHTSTARPKDATLLVWDDNGNAEYYSRSGRLLRKKAVKK